MTKNTTSIPNDLFGGFDPEGQATPGLMADMTEAELKVYLAVLRLTVGDSKKQRGLSIRKMCALTGLSKNSVKAAAHSLEVKGLAQRTVHMGQSFWAVK